jgi:dihydroflavonol-4-reductase
MECALATGVTKVVHVSSVVIYGKPVDSPFKEESAVGPIRFSEYAKTKFEGDLLAWKSYQEKKLPLVMIYPGVVLGSGDNKASGRYMKNMVNRRLPAKVFQNTVFSLVHVNDVVEAIIRAAEKRDNLGEKYIVCKDQLSFREMNELIHDISGVRLPLLSFPNWLVMATAALLTGLANLTKKAPLLDISWDQMRTMKESMLADGSKAERELNLKYTPIRRAFEEAIETHQKQEADFLDWKGQTTYGINIGSAQIDLPIKYYRDDCFMGFFSADYNSVKKLLPSDKLYPIKLLGGRAVVAVAAFNYIATSIGSYGEIGVVVPCIYGRRPLPLLPLLLEALYPGWVVFIHHLPVTSRVACDAGKVIWGYPKFVADMDFQKLPGFQRVRLEEGGKHILTLTVQQRGISIKDRRPLVTCSKLNKELLKTSMPLRSIYQLGLRPESGKLMLGDHKIADQLRNLDISMTAIVTKNYLSKYLILPAGEPMGVAEGSHSDYVGQDLEFGRLTITYDTDRMPIDLYSGMEKTISN